MSTERANIHAHAHTCMHTHTHTCTRIYSGKSWQRITTDQTAEPAFMQKDLIVFQEPNEADKLIKIQRSLDDVKDIMSKNLGACRDRTRNGGVSLCTAYSCVWTNRGCVSVSVWCA